MTEPTAVSAEISALSADLRSLELPAPVPVPLGQEAPAMSVEERARLDLRAVLESRLRGLLERHAALVTAR